MKRILECFDEELLERAKQTLGEGGIAYSETTEQDASMTRLCLDVADVDGIAGSAVIRSVADAIESDRSPMRCSRCGTGMLLVEKAVEDQDEPPLVTEYRCPRCGAPGLMNID